MAGNIDFEAILNSISDERSRQGFRLLLNLVEELVAKDRSLREENQRLKDEINRLKGEQGKPEFKPRKPMISIEPVTARVVNTEAPSQLTTDHSSEKERRKPKEWRKGSKVDRITIDRKQYLAVDPSLLPPDALRKGYGHVVVQDLKVATDNVLFLKEKWYSPSAGKTYLAELPPGYTGEYGPQIKALALSLYYGGNLSQPKLLEFFHNAGIILSAGALSRILTQEQEAFHAVFHQEYDEIYREGINSTLWQGTDHTPTTINGEPHECQVVANSLYSIYATTATKDRLSILDVLLNQHEHQHEHQTERTYLLNEQAHRHLQSFKFSSVIWRTLHKMPHKQFIPESVFLALLEERLPQLSKQQYNQVLDAGAIAAYHAQQDWPTIHLLLCDDAPAFKGITAELQLCWVHEGRHYKKLSAFVPLHREILKKFQEQFWDYYEELLAYREQPTPKERKRLSQQFDRIFTQSTGYQELDKRIKMTCGKKEMLLTVLKYPQVPLHNNGSELAARGRVRKRDVSFGPRSREGSRAWDTFMSIAATARKLKVSFYHYLYDRLSKSYAMPSLACMIQQHTLKLALKKTSDLYLLAA